MTHSITDRQTYNDKEAEIETGRPYIQKNFLDKNVISIVQFIIIFL